jgi:RNase P subunit RPR2
MLCPKCLQPTLTEAGIVIRGKKYQYLILFCTHCKKEWMIPTSRLAEYDKDLPVLPKEYSRN